MLRLRRISIAVALLAALMVGTTSLATADGEKVLDASMAGISQANQILYGVQGGGLPWTLDFGSARLFADGRLQVTVKGLVIASGPNTGRNPAPTGRAIVTCAGAPVAMSSIVPFSVPDGDARINETIALPADCAGPAVFFAGITGAGPRWFGVTGW